MDLKDIWYRYGYEGYRKLKLLVIDINLSTFIICKNVPSKINNRSNHVSMYFIFL